jgi:hypothetical protein
VTRRIEVTIDELVLDGVEAADERVRLELVQRLREQHTPAVASNAEQVAARVARAVDEGVRR